MPRYTRATIERALGRLKDQIAEVNRNPKGAYRVLAAVAFGDFLNKNATRVQAADVGVRLEGKNTEDRTETVIERKSEALFLKHLRNGMAMAQLHSFEDWMDKRSHIRIL